MDYDYPIEVRIFRQEQYDGDWMPTNLGDAIAWLQEMMEQIPAEYREGAGIEIDSTGGYEGSHYATIEISYRRPPTPEEVEKRKAEVAARARQDLEMAKRRAEEAQRRLSALQ